MKRPTAINPHGIHLSVSSMGREALRPVRDRYRSLLLLALKRLYGDIVSQILNFGLPAPIDVQVIGNDQKANYAYATDLLKRIRTVPGIADFESSKSSTTHK